MSRTSIRMLALALALFLACVTATHFTTTTILLLTVDAFTPTLLNPIPTPAGGATLRIVCAPEDERFTQPAVDRFQLLYPQVKVELIVFPHSSTDRLSYYQDEYFRKQSTAIDLVSIDVVYPGVLEEYLLDLNQWNMSSLAAQFNPTAIENNIVNGKLLALPLHTDFGILFYRTDLLKKYNYTAPPKTYQELAEMSRVIVEGEEAANGNYILQGYAFQGAAYEGLTCDAMEWIDSFGGGTVLELDQAGKPIITINNPRAIEAIDSIASFVGTTVTSVTMVDAQETQSDAAFSNGNAVFLRSWPSMYYDLRNTPVDGKWNATYLPSSNSTQRGSSVLGGFSWSISKYSTNPEWSILLMSYLLSPSELFQRGSIGKIPATLPGVIPNATQMCNSSMPSFCNLPAPKLVARPSTIAGTNYALVSQLLYRGVNDVLIKRYNATVLVAKLECDLSTLLGIRVERCMEGIATPYAQSDFTIKAFTAISVILLILTALLTVATFIYRQHQVMKAATASFLGLMLLGCMLGYACVITLIQYEPTKAICALQACFAHIAFTLIFGSLFLKTYRLHVIFNATKLEIIPISNMQLLGKQAILLAATGVYLAIWLGVDPPTPTLTQVLNTSYVVCHSQQSYWPNLILVVEGLSVAYGVYLCLAVRSIPSLFNESSYVAISIYNLAVLGTIILLITKVALTVYDKAVLFECSAVLVVLLVTTILIVGSKFFMIFRGSNGSEVSSNMTARNNTGLSIGGDNSHSIPAPTKSSNRNPSMPLHPSHRRSSSTGKVPHAGAPNFVQLHTSLVPIFRTRASLSCNRHMPTLSLGDTGKNSPTNATTFAASEEANLLLIATLRDEVAELRRLLFAQTQSQLPSPTPQPEQQQKQQQELEQMQLQQQHELQNEAEGDRSSRQASKSQHEPGISHDDDSREIVQIHAVGPMEFPAKHDAEAGSDE